MYLVMDIDDLLLFNSCESQNFQMCISSRISGEYDMEEQTCCFRLWFCLVAYFLLFLLSLFWTLREKLWFIFYSQFAAFVFAKESLITKLPFTPSFFVHVLVTEQHSVHCLIIFGVMMNDNIVKESTFLKLWSRCSVIELVFLQIKYF